MDNDIVAIANRAADIGKFADENPAGHIAAFCISMGRAFESLLRRGGLTAEADRVQRDTNALCTRMDKFVDRFLDEKAKEKAGVRSDASD